MGATFTLSRNIIVTMIVSINKWLMNKYIILRQSEGEAKFWEKTTISNFTYSFAWRLQEIVNGNNIYIIGEKILLTTIVSIKKWLMNLYVIYVKVKENNKENNGN